MTVIVCVRVMVMLFRLRGVSINDLTTLSRWGLEVSFQPAHNFLCSCSSLQIGEHKRLIASPAAGVAFHHFERSANVWR